MEHSQVVFGFFGPPNEQVPEAVGPEYPHKNKNPISTAETGFIVESEGFEPPDLLQSAVFKTAAIDHSASSLKR